MINSTSFCGLCYKPFTGLSCTRCGFRIQGASNYTSIIPQGVKHDQGKPDHTYISNDLLDGLAAVRAFGAQKYDRDNWRKGFKFNRSIAAALRHINAFKEGEDLDSESNLCHILHAVACLEHLLGDYLHRPQNDDRYKLPSKLKVADNKE